MAKNTNSSIQKTLSGVYCILNQRTSKYYIGSSSTCIVERMRKHRESLRHGTHCNSYLQRAWNRYGENCFEFFAIEVCAPNQCLILEQLYIFRYKAAQRHFGYNLSPCASSSRGRKLSLAHRRRFNFTGRKHTEETKRKISLSGKGRKCSAEQIQRMTEAHKNSPVWQAAMAARRPEMILQLARARANYTQETRDKVAAWHRGKKRSEEAKARMREGIKISPNRQHKTNG